MKKHRRLSAPEQPPQLNLPPRRLQQIFASYDMRDPLQPVVDDSGKLIRPVATTIADEQIAALLGWPLLLRPYTKIVEELDARIEAYPDSSIG
jgi:hypothetical protein